MSVSVDSCSLISVLFFFQAEDGIRDLVRSRGLGDVYKRQLQEFGVDQYYFCKSWPDRGFTDLYANALNFILGVHPGNNTCLLYTSDAADERSSVDLGGRRIIKKKKNEKHERLALDSETHIHRGRRRV